jgi:hypothetical protein
MLGRVTIPQEHVGAAEKFPNGEAQASRFRPSRHPEKELSFGHSGYAE